MAYFKMMSLALLISLSSLTVIRAKEETISLEGEFEPISTSTKLEDDNSSELLQGEEFSTSIL